ncbi:MAG: aspartate aminotransferase family protein, partial [Gemmatimonadales bacterium]
TYFVNSGSEANDLAVTMARLYTGNYDMIAVRNAYHGTSPSTTGLTSHQTWKPPVPQAFGIHHTVNPDPYRSLFRGTPEDIASQCIGEMKNLIRFSTPGRVAGFICEPLMGVGGVTGSAPNYLREAYETVRAHGGLAIADEVQTGFGRTGNHYWGFENWGVVPDIVTMAKSLGNGQTIAAVTTRAEIAKALTQRLHLNTFGGNPVSAAAGLAVLDVIDEDGLQENSRVIGGRLKAGLEKLKESHPLVGDVRGMGLMLGVELVRDRATKEPATKETGAVLDATKEMGLLVGKGGIDGNVLRIKPPMIITAEDVDFALDVLDRALTQVEGRG